MLYKAARFEIAVAGNVPQPRKILSAAIAQILSTEISRNGILYGKILAIKPLPIEFAKNF
jgi:hypothetical protein